MKAGDMEKLFAALAKKCEKKPSARTAAEKIDVDIKKREPATEMCTKAGATESLAQFGGDSGAGGGQ
jgi:hypothetical protein